MRELLVSKIQCPDGTILESRHQHDFKQHIQSDGRKYFVDGGVSYQRIGASDDKFVNLYVYSDDDYGTIRDNFIWGRNFDKEGNRLPKTEYVKLKDLTDDHLEALCTYTLEDYPAKINKVFLDEQQWRNKGE